MDNDVFEWRPWHRFHLDFDAFPCEDTTEIVPAPEQTASERASEVLAYQAAYLTLPLRSTGPRLHYGVYARAKDYPPAQAAQPDGICDSWPSDEALSDEPYAEGLYRHLLMRRLAHTLDSLITAMRKDSTVVVP